LFVLARGASGGICEPQRTHRAHCCCYLERESERESERERERERERA
jgi:hypothetical protein